MLLSACLVLEHSSRELCDVHDTSSSIGEAVDFGSYD